MLKGFVGAFERVLKGEEKKKKKVKKSWDNTLDKRTSIYCPYQISGTSTFVVMDEVWSNGPII